jgi:hypothetical protein
LKKRKPILLIDDTIESQEAKNMLFSNNIDFIEYNIISLEEVVVDIFLQLPPLAFLHQKEYIRGKLR